MPPITINQTFLSFDVPLRHRRTPSRGARVQALLPHRVTALTTHTSTLSTGQEGAWVTLQWSFKASGVYDAAMGRSLDNITVTNMRWLG